VACGGEISAIQIDKSTDFEGMGIWESSAISIVRVAVLSSRKCITKCEDGGFDLASIVMGGTGVNKNSGFLILTSFLYGIEEIGHLALVLL
jgi:hypothetical protein